MAVSKRTDKNGRKLPDGVSQRPDGRYQARFTYNGKRYTLYDKTLKTLLEKVVTKKNMLYNNIYSDLSKISLNQWFDKWVTLYKKDKIRELTYSNYRKYWTWYVEESLGKMKVSSIKRIHIITLYNDLLYGEKHIAVGTIEYINNLVYSSLEQAVYNDIIQRNPAKDIMKEIKLPPKKKKEALTQQEQKCFLDYIAGSEMFSRYAPMFIVAFYTGVRVGELTALTWDDIDFDSRKIVINKTLHYVRYFTEEGHHYLITEPKTENSKRLVPMVGKVKEALIEQKQYLKLLGCEDCFSINGFSDFIFKTNNGRPYTADGVNQEIKRIIKFYNKDEDKKAENEKRESVYLKDFSPHIMRHTFASRCFENGISPKVIQVILGHSKIDTTLDIYTHCSQQLVQEQMALLEEKGSI